MSNGESHQNFIEIEQVIFDDALKEFNLNIIDFVKVNIEGAEMDLLKSLDNSNLKIKNWCISCHDFKGKDYRTFDYVYTWLKKSNYHVDKYSSKENINKWRSYYLYGSKTNV